MCSAGLADAHAGLQDRILLNYSTQEFENAHKVRIKTFLLFQNFLLFTAVQQTFNFFFFPVETISNAWMLLC